MKWYALFVKATKEDNVQKWLDFYFDKEILRSLVPKRKLIEKKTGKFYVVLKKLFPGYVFIYTTMDFYKYRIIKSIPNLLRILTTSNYYTQIEEDEMSIILKLIKNDTIIDYSKVSIEDSKVLVIDGPLYGMEGIIRKINKHTKRARIQLKFMDEPRFVDVGIEIL